jgi:hypothetical protein
VLDILVAEVVLQRAGVVSIVGQLEPVGVPQHVWVGWEGQPRDLVGAGYQFADVARRHRAAALGHKQVRTF